VLNIRLLNCLAEEELCVDIFSQPFSNAFEYSVADLRDNMNIHTGAKTI
jgi:hypothetical protein